ncbi:MAG: indolepyruvate ferredoxin oxidoreductase subunit alpha [Chloroflexota bacterium]
MIKLLSGNEAFALGAYHAGVMVATAYPGTPSSEILENIAKFPEVYAEWSTNEKVAMEVALGASYAGVRAMASMKQVGLNVASDPFMAAATTGINGGLVVVCADDPGIHSSQCEQDNRHFAKLAKVPMLEPTDSQEAYDLMPLAFEISERFDTPTLVRSTTRISHSKSVVNVRYNRPATSPTVAFKRNPEKYVMLPTSARLRRPLIEERLVKLAEYSDVFMYNKIEWGDRSLGIVSSGIAYQYAREVFPTASFLKLGITYPLPVKMLREFAAGVKRVIVIEELDPFLEENICALGINATGKDFIPRIGELNSGIVAESCRHARLLPKAVPLPPIKSDVKLPARPPLLCAGCPHTAPFFVLSTIGKRSLNPKVKDSTPKESGLVITGDIGCYTLGAYPPWNVMDTTTCMGAGIGEALGMEKAGLDDGRKIVALIGDSTFIHSGITPLVDAVYNQGHFTLIILDNGTTAMTGHQPHPGTGVSAKGEPSQAVDIEKVVRAIGVQNVKVVNAFDLKEVRDAIRTAIDSNQLSVIITRGGCSVLLKKRTGQMAIDASKCNQCGVCLTIGCPAIQTAGDQPFIDASMCAGDACTVCQQICPHQAIAAITTDK